MATHPEDKNDAVTAAAPASGGFKAWLPLILTILLMPVLAYVLTTFVLLPKLQKSLGGASGDAGESAPASGEHHGGSVKVNAREPGSGKGKTKVSLSKIVVNVSGSLGTRLLLTSLTLAGNGGDFKGRVEDNNDQLRDIASSILSSKTIADLEKPESRNLIRAELLSQFNTALGNGFVQEIYITEFAIQ
ncbi:MAG: flagellar protein FliL [Verrucomicrobiota bacterium]|jgi:flagellar basal body-associated protein FliL